MRACMPRRCKEDAEKTRRQIISEALNVFAEKGFARSTFEEIAARLKLTKGAVYWHFKNKPALLSAVIAMALEERSKKLGALPAEVSWGELRDYLVRWAEYSLRVPLARKFFYVLQFQVEWSSELLESLREYLKEVEAGPHQMIYERLAGMQHRGELREGVNVEELACLVCGVWFGGLKCYAVDRLSFDLPAALTRALDALVAEYLIVSDMSMRKRG